MDKDKVMLIANETAGQYWMDEAHIQRFAALVAAAARAEEREGCAKVCDDAPEPDGRDLAERIRARGETK